MSGYPRESVEHQPITVKVNGVEVTTGVEVSVVYSSARPTAWTTPTLLDGKLGVMVTGLAVGIWDVWARPTGYAPETPVIFCGSFHVT